jgi:ADP-ribose pyrophosphatase YjhB (NUDIX family)
MPELAVNIAIIHAGRILLTQREDFKVGCLPGGAVDPGESIAQAAVREVREETGLDVELTRLVGIYSRPKARGVHLVLFAARPTGGELRFQAGEVIDAGYFDPDALPEPLLAWHHQQIVDALRGAQGLAWTQKLAWPFDPEMTRQQFYLQHFRELGPEDAILEVGDVPPAEGGS